MMIYIFFFSYSQTEEEKVLLERKTREAEFLTARLVEESERRAAEAERLKDHLLRARLAEKQAKEKLLEFLSVSVVFLPLTLSLSLKKKRTNITNTGKQTKFCLLLIQLSFFSSFSTAHHSNILLIKNVFKIVCCLLTRRFQFIFLTFFFLLSLLNVRLLLSLLLHCSHFVYM